MAKACSREDDDRDLAVLQRALRGEPLRQISLALGFGTSFAQVSISRIRKADLDHACVGPGAEDPEIVAAYYPRGTK